MWEEASWNLQNHSQPNSSACALSYIRKNKEQTLDTLQSERIVYTWGPHPMPNVEMADGGDQDPSSLRAITNPVPTL